MQKETFQVYQPNRPTVSGLTFYVFQLMIGFPSLPQVQQKVSEVEVREKELFDWRKKVSEVECKLTQQENLLECAVKERNLSSRNLLEAQVQLLQLLPQSHSRLLLSLSLWKVKY